VAEGRALDAELSELLRHELIHRFVREVGGSGVPAWLNEGLAQWLQRDPSRDVAAAREALRAREPLALERLQAPFAALKGEGEIALAYAESLAFVAWLDAHHGREALLRMVAGCAASKPVAESFESWSGISLALAFDDLRQDLALGR